MKPQTLLSLILLLIFMGSANTYAADGEASPTVQESTPKTSNAPYALPWQLRPVFAVNVIRLDTATAFYNDRNNNNGGVGYASIATASYKLTPDLAMLLRLGMMNNNPPATAVGATSILNPLLGTIYSYKINSDFRLGLFLGITAPIGSGGGDYPSAAVQAANSAGILARSAMDNALFATNYLTVIPGLDFAYIANGLTLQVETTLLQLMRTRGSQIDKDSTRTNFTTGLAAGYAVHPMVFIESELRYQRWLNNNTVSNAASPANENLSIAFGPRFNLKVFDITTRPGIAYAHGLAGPIAKSGYTSTTNSDKIIFVDIPIFF